MALAPIISVAQTVISTAFMPLSLPRHCVGFYLTPRIFRSMNFLLEGILCQVSKIHSMVIVAILEFLCSNLL